MASFAEHRKILKQIESFKPQLEKLVEASLTLAKNHFTNSFREQGFTDESKEAWKPRKRADRGRSKGERSILVKSGRLRRSLRTKKINSLAGKIYTDVPYAKVHNEGLTINKKASNRTINFKVGRDGKSRFSTAKKANFQQDITIGAHSIKMPKRQFIGYSGKLNRQIIAFLDKNIKKQFNK